MLRQLRPRASLFQSQPSRLIAAATYQQQQSRLYSIQANAASDLKAQDIDPSKLSITKTTTPKQLVPPNELVFGRTFTGPPLFVPIFALILPSPFLLSLPVQPPLSMLIIHVYIHIYLYTCKYTANVHLSQTTCSPSNGPPQTAGSPLA